MNDFTQDRDDDDQLDGLGALIDRVARQVHAEPVPPARFDAVRERFEAARDPELEAADPELAAIVNRVKARTEVELMAKRERPGFSAIHAPGRSSGRNNGGGRKRPVWVAPLTIAAAAAIFLLVGSRLRTQQGAVAAGQTPNAAALVEQAGDGMLPANQIDPVKKERAFPATRADEVLESAPSTSDAPTKERLNSPEDGEASNEPPTKPAARSEARASKSTSAKPTSSKRSARQLELDAMLDAAEQDWRKGDARSAEKTLLALVAKGKSAQADAAWGDLFTLARQLRGPASEYERWGEYLRSYPKGRHADDARAGRCRLGPADEPAQCWGAYLNDFPAGAHRGEARLALEESP